MRRPLLRGALLALAPLTALTGVAHGQYGERPALHGSGSPLVDVSGRSIKNKRVRAIHTTSPATNDGGTAYLLAKDPFLAYQLGKNLNFRQFRSRDGLFGKPQSSFSGTLPDGTTFRETAYTRTSCGSCHSFPYGTPGAGGNVPRIGGEGRNVPHYFGGGLVEMLGQQLRDELYALLDLNFDGWISVAEAQAAPTSFIASPQTGALPIDYGNPQLTGGTTGVPQLNPLFRIWYVNAVGQHVSTATQVDGIATHGYNFAPVPFGWGEPEGGGFASTLRQVIFSKHDRHAGLQAFDQTSRTDGNGDGVGVSSLAGALQYPAVAVSPDDGSPFDLGFGFSRADLDVDGSMNELSEGDVDLWEWYLLNAPPPTYAGTTASYTAGVAELDTMGCTTCHVESWDLRARDTIHTGDRRFFDFDAMWIPSTLKLRGRRTDLTTVTGGAFVPNYAKFTVSGIFTDLKHHDMGEGFKELDFGGNEQTTWRTPPLWGVGSSGPWGHDGDSPTIQDAILRHDGDALFAKNAFKAAAPAQQATVITFLSNLVLFDPRAIDSDIDGSATVSSSFMVGGMNTGTERFNPEWLFKVPLVIQGPVVNSAGNTITSFAGTNIDAAYAQLLNLRIDSDSDGWPDIWDAAPFFPGFKDGVF